jgi:hypothetical protein
MVCVLALDVGCRRIRHDKIANIGIIDGVVYEIETFRDDEGRFPTNLNELSARGVPKDAWGRALVYTCTLDSFTLSSAGPDGIQGTGDDYVYQESSGP